MGGPNFLSMQYWKRNPLIPGDFGLVKVVDLTMELTVPGIS